MKNLFDYFYRGLFRFSQKDKFVTKLTKHQFVLLNPERKQLLEEKLKIQIHNSRLYEEALLHRSYLPLLPKGQYNSNERLEFLGDSILGMIVSEYLFLQNPNLPEGELTKIRSWLVNKKSLSLCARKLELDKFLLVSFSTAKSLHQGSDSILSDAVEALIGAIYLDKGFDLAKKFVVETLIPLLQDENILRDKNYKSILMETVQAEGKNPPTYKVLEEYGPSHDKTFVVGVYVDGNLLATGKGKSKKEAEQDAAHLALETHYSNNKERKVNGT